MRHPETPDFEKAAHAGINWLKNLAIDKPKAKDWPRDLQAHYKLPLVFSLTDNIDMAIQQLGIAKELFLDGKGHFRENEVTLPYVTYCYFYRDWWLGMAADLLKDETSKDINGSIAELQTDNGFRWSPVSPNTSLLATAVGGLKFISADELERAHDAARAVSEVLHMQPHPDQAFYLNRDPSGNLIDSQSSSWFAFMPGQSKPIYYVFGLSSYLLATAAHGESKLLEDAEAFHSYYRNICGVATIEHPYSGKIGLASSMLYKLTGNPIFRDTAITAARYLIRRQSPDGRWTLEEFIKPDGSNALSVEADRTAEFVILLNAIHANLTEQTIG
ncbi:MAG: hypothetical protein UY16_C0010G0006 [Candidatus Gottesmanbacteria bacterium GW2011_GWA2_47_9]|uniref:Uncharacterized protein n=1 Tax=Candidatus Gottesmanbacteria bacterium GW2011_GWA2_47_9 TaxID=1618445 RepID=A0A0G1X1E1_9BACT|nr:MAG: hypothetical protein UY16_C0010G0006 [Candidatus Gottesmanbacteria bacterium GW2011_GWA2_47_9]